MFMHMHRQQDVVNTYTACKVDAKDGGMLYEFLLFQTPKILRTVQGTCKSWLLVGSLQAAWLLEVRKLDN